MKIGYARISTKDQSFDLQIDALKKAGCEKIFKDISSGKNKNRKQFDEMLAFARENDTIIVWKLDRAGRSLNHLISLINDLQNKKVDFLAINDNIDTSTATGRLIFHIFASLAEFESSLIKERTLAGLSAARARGKKGGRPTVITKNISIAAKGLYKNKNITVKEMCETLKISRATFYKIINKGTS